MKLNYRRTFFVGLAFLSICAFWELYDGIVPKMLEGTFHLDEVQTGYIMALDNVLALFLLPFIGALSDKVDTKLGKRMPFIIGGTLVASIFIIVLPIAEHGRNLVLFFVALGMILLSMASYRSPAVALMPDITPKPLRSKANAIINLMGTLGGAYALVMIKLFYKGDGSNNVAVFLSIVLLMIVAVALLLITIPEKKLTKELEQLKTKEEIEEEKREARLAQNVKGIKLAPEVQKSFILIMSSIFLWFFAYNAVKTAFSRYAEKVWGLPAGEFTNPLMVALGAALISYIPIGFISSKIGRKKMILIGIGLLTVSYFCGFLVPEYTFYVNIIFAVTGIGWAAINVNSYPMVVEMCQGADTGKYTGYYYTFSMSAQILTPILSGFLLKNVSYRTLFPYAVIFSLASFCTMFFVKHGDSKPMKRSTIIENFDTED